MQYNDDLKWISDAWKCIDDPSFMTCSSSSGFNFTIANILNYFIHRKAQDGNPTNDYKDVNNKAYPLYKAGFVQSVLYKTDDSFTTVMIRAICAAEMKKSVAYKLRLVIHNNEVLFAACGCPAGRGPTGICKHIGALCYFIEDLCRTKIIHYQSSTSTLQQWHQPARKRKSSPLTLDTVKFQKAEYGKVKREIFTSNHYDPRPSTFAKTTLDDVMVLRDQLQQLRTPVGLLHVLPMTPHHDDPPLTSTSALTLLPPITRSALCKVHASFQREPKPPTLQTIYQHGLMFTDMICHSRGDRERIELHTRKQSKSARWFEEHYGRLTSSSFGNFCKGSITTSKVNSVLSIGKHSASKQTNSAIQWGQLHEETAYQIYGNSLPPTNQLRKAGIFISECGILAASPDGVVSCDDSIVGLLEIKCPYSCRNMTVRDACFEVKSFYCQLDDENCIHLKKDHHYYYQVQGAMGLTGAQWCDFVVWTPKECIIERIPYDEKFWELTKQHLKQIYFSYILPELVYPRICLGLDVIKYDFTRPPIYQSLEHIEHEP